ncbi:uncharacterized protein ACNS7B_006308 [Menidia menidia]
MMTRGFFLRVPLSALLIVATCGAPFKGSKDQSSSGSHPAANSGSYRRKPASGSFGGSSGSSVAPALSPSLVASPSFTGSFAPGQVVAQAPGFSTFPSDPRLGGSGSLVPAQAVVQAPGVPQLVQPGPFVGLSSAPVASYVPVGVGYDSGSSDLGDPSGMEETAWAVSPQDFSGLDASGNAQALNLGDVLPAPSLPQSGPVLQSGETSSVVKEAELGNYQQQTEEFGYPDDLQVSGPGYPTVLVPQFGVGGFRGSPYPNFDYRLLYGQYPPGTYSTFSQQNEKGKDYSQEIHYLKEHVGDGDDSGQQKKFFPGAQ